jgi:hypothetical protein
LFVLYQKVFGSKQAGEIALDLLGVHRGSVCMQIV